MKKILASILALAAVLSLTACGETSPAAETVTVTKLSRSFAPIEITGDNVLNSVRVFDTMYEDNKQAMFSPLSLNMCLGMLEAGAAGDSKTALDNYLGNTDYAAFAEGYLEHAKDFTFEVKTGAFSKYKESFEIANSFWVNKDLEFNGDYKKRVADSFGAEIENIDFTKKTAAVKKINDWVNDKTHKMIPAIIGEEHIADNTAAVLVNTVYFESGWRDEWSVLSEKKHFTRTNGSTVDVELMRNSGDSYFENDNATAFSCYYKNNMQFIGILPKNEGEFTLESLDIPSLLESETRIYDVYARMPKLNFESEFPLTDALKAAGLENIFDPEAADFTPMQGSGDIRFSVSEVIQRTKLELDGEGTKAAAATATTVKATGAAMPNEREEKFVYLDRPFAFLIYDGTADQIVFMGKVTEP
ncbi:MAG: serpin family protein [Oscillospiraceae bacterium]|nr:serpin family protein [Oscillospiraceae bacterium]